MAQKMEPSSEADEIDIGKLFHTLWIGKWFILLIVTITTIIGIAYALMATPIYQGDALLQIEAKSSGFAGLTGLADAFGGGDSETSTELQILKSRKVITPTIEKFQLEIEAEPITFPIFGQYFARKFGNNDGLATPMFGDYIDFTKEYAWGGEQIIVNKFEVPRALYKSVFEIIKLENDFYHLKLGDQEIFKGKVGKLYHLKEWNIDIQLGRLRARTGTHFSLVRKDLVLVIDQLVKDLAVSEVGKKSGIVTIKMQGKDKVKIKNIIDHILTTYQQQNVEYNSIEADKSLDFVKSQLPGATGKLKQSERALYEYRLNNKTVDLTLQTVQLLQKILNIEERLNELRLQEPEISRKFKRSHPIYIEFLRKKQDLTNQRAEIDIATGQIPAEQFNIFRLQRDVELTQKTYLQMLNKFEELKIIKAGTIGSIRVIDKTIVHPVAVKPNKAIIVIIAFMLGFVLSVTYLMVKALLLKGVESIEQLEEMGYNVYASIPLSPLEEKLAKLKPKLGEMRILSDLHPEELSVEALRSLRTSLHFAMMEAENNIIMITGASPGIGKSFISQNLAALIAQSGKKTLLVDLDFRRGRIHDSFGLAANPGFSEYLSGFAEFDDVLHKTKIKGLDIVARGKSPPNPSELLMGKQFANFCKLQQKNYDFIIFDTPPILAVTDASIVGKFAGTTMLVVKQGVNHIKEIEQASNKLLITGVEIRGYILNGITKKSHANIYQYEYT